MEPAARTVASGSEWPMRAGGQGARVGSLWAPTGRQWPRRHQIGPYGGGKAAGLACRRGHSQGQLGVPLGSPHGIQGLKNKELNCALRYIPSNLRCIPDRVCINVKYPDLDNGSPIESILGFYSNLIPDRIRIESDHDIRYNLSANDVDQK